MIHIYKAGGERKTQEGVEYTIDAINEDSLQDKLADGWVLSLGEIKPKPKKAAKDGNSKQG